MQEIVYKAKVDTWIKYFLQVLIIGTTSILFFIPFDKGFWIVASIILLSNGLVIWLFFNTYTTLTLSEIKHQCGPIEYVIPYGNIILIKRKATHFIQHGTWSMDKIEIKHRRGILVIAPEDKEEFIQRIAAKNPEIEVI